MNNIYIFALPFLLGCLLFNCQKSDLDKMDSIDQKSLPDEISKNVKLIYSDSGKVKQIMTSPLIYKFTTDTIYTEFPEGVHVEFFDKNGKILNELTCGYALTTGENNENLIFRKNVKLRNYKEKTLLSDEIYLKDSVIYSDSTVYIVTPTITLKGTSLVAPRDFSTYKLSNPEGVARTEVIELEK